MTEPYKQYASDLYAKTPRSVARHAALSLLSIADQIRGQSGALRRPRVQIIAMHHLLGDEVDGFRRLLRAFSHDHVFLSYSDAVERIWRGDIDRPYLTFTFDDGFASCVQAAQLLDEVGAKACFFVCPQIMGESDIDAVYRFCRQRLEMPPLPFMSWEQVQALLQRGHEVGSHTMSHANLAGCSHIEMQTEIGQSREILTRRLGSVRHFAWPFGRFFHFSGDAARAVFDAGYDSCASSERGCHVAPETDKKALCLRRDHIIATWPAGHVKHFLMANSRAASARQNEWPSFYSGRR